jgi:hypothetical protein
MKAILAQKPKARGAFTLRLMVYAVAKDAQP